MDYSIVSQKGQLKTVRENIAGRESLPGYHEEHHLQRKIASKKGELIQQCTWFNRVPYKDMSLNILHFEEMNGEKKCQWDWITSHTITSYHAYLVDAQT